MEICLKLEVSFIYQRTDGLFELLTKIYFLLANQSIHIFFNAFLFLKSLTYFLSSFFVVCLTRRLLDNNGIIFINGNVQGLTFWFFLLVLIIGLIIFISVQLSLYFLGLRNYSLVMQSFDLYWNIGWFWRLHYLYVWEAYNIVAYFLRKLCILFHKLIKFLLLIHIHFKIVNKHLWILLEHILYSVSYLFLVSINAADKLHFLKLLKLKKLLFLSLIIIASNWAIGHQHRFVLKLIKVSYLSVMFYFLRAELLTLFVEIWSLNHIAIVFETLIIYWGS